MIEIEEINAEDAKCDIAATLIYQAYFEPYDWGDVTRLVEAVITPSKGAKLVATFNSVLWQVYAIGPNFETETFENAYIEYATFEACIAAHSALNGPTSPDELSKGEGE